MVICSICGRDIDAIGQDNLGFSGEPVCEECFLPEKDNVGRGQMDCFDCQLRADHLS